MPLDTGFPIPGRAVVGQPVDRRDGRLKVTGHARYAARRRDGLLIDNERAWSVTTIIPFLGQVSEEHAHRGNIDDCLVHTFAVKPTPSARGFAALARERAGAADAVLQRRCSRH